MLDVINQVRVVKRIPIIIYEEIDWYEAFETQEALPYQTSEYLKWIDGVPYAWRIQSI